MAMNVAQHKIINLLKTSWDIFVIICHKVFNVWPKYNSSPSSVVQGRQKFGHSCNSRGLDASDGDQV